MDYLRKSFENEDLMEYKAVAEGAKIVELENFSKLYRQLPSRETMFSMKDSAGRQLIEIFESVPGGRIIHENHIRGFLNKPLIYKIDLVPGSKELSILNKIKNSQAMLNELSGHYAVCISELQFLRYKYNEAKTKNLEWEKFFNEKRTKLSVSDLGTHTDEVIVLNKEEQEMIQEVIEEEQKAPLIAKKTEEEGEETSEDEFEDVEESIYKKTEEDEEESENLPNPPEKGEY